MKPKNKSNITKMDIVELANHLRLENLFITAEKRQIQKLNEKVLATSERLFHFAWIVRKQRQNFEKVVFSQKDTNPGNCCFIASALENASFVDSYKKLSSYDAYFSDLLSKLRKNPKLVAQCLIEGESISMDATSITIPILMSSLYCDCLLQEDKTLVLHLMRELLIHQLTGCDNPRRVLRQGICAFSKVYKIFSECLASAKLFLTVCLREAVINLLIEDDLYLDIDPQRAVQRFSREERLRHFGQEKSSSYNDSLLQFRMWTIKKLSTLVLKFIEGIQSNIHCFPESLCWLVKQMYSTLKSSEKVDEREIWFICADFVFGNFICHAIVNPELYGIVDIHVNNISRFNLMQVAQIIQALVLSKYEDTDPKLDYLYSNFSKDCLSSVLDFLLVDCTNELPTGTIRSVQEVTRTCALITESDLHHLMKFLLDVSKSCKNSETKKSVCDLLSNISESVVDKLLGDVYVTQESNEELTYCDLRSKKNIVTRVSRRTKGETIEVSASSDISSNLQCKELKKFVKIEVLIIPLNQFREFQSPGMLSEERVLKIEMQKRHTKVRMNLDTDNSRVNDETESVISSSIVCEKKPRFSQDQESVGTSDNLEAVSEAASNHSVASSVDLENENENDNLSDMVSANVSSGRGTPNVSGRETPTSQSSQNSSDDGNDNTAVSNVNDSVDSRVQRENRDTLNAIPIQQPNRANNRDDIEGRFGKFDCKPCSAADETKSLLSDTWSTDVLASDSEALEQSDTNITTHGGGINFLGAHALPGNILDASETASQSDAWSTDVLTSDTERLQEFDLDETSSVTRSDDSNMTRSELDIDDSSAGGAVGGDNGVLQNFIYFDEDYSKDGTIKHSVHRKSKAQETDSLKSASDSNADRVKSPCDNDKPNFNSVSANNASCLLGNMQTLGRLSFDVRKLPFSDEDPVSLILPYLRDKTPNDDSEPLKNHRSSITELLSLDFSPNSQNESKTPASNDSSSENLNLIEFEKEISVFETPKLENERNNSKADLLTGESHQNLQVPDARCSYASASSASTVESVVDVDVAESESLKHKEISKVNAIDTRESFMSTGAIPKTQSASKLSRSNNSGRTNNDDEGHRSGRKGFFKLPNLKTTLKEKMKSFKDKKFSNTGDALNNTESDVSPVKSRDETSDEILEKYRERKEPPVIRTCSGASHNLTENAAIAVGDEDESVAFENTKKILRHVLSTVDVQMLPLSPNNILALEMDNLCLRQNTELMKFLKTLLAEAKYMHNSAQIVAIQEAIRFVEAFDDKSSQKLFWSLREDYQRRSPYIAYLIRCRQGLLSTIAQFDNLLEHLLREKEICNYNLISACCRLFLESKERVFHLFEKKFQKLTVSDEKAQLVEKFLSYLYNSMESDSIWQVASEEQLDYAKSVIERSVMSQIYVYAIYPNGDGDVLRDQVLFKHMENLAKYLSPDHKDLRIPKMYHCECPWPVAQDQILTINAFKTPRDKVQCVVRCCTVIMNLLSLVNEKSVPAADDLIPVLVYVLIKANPVALLSNVQYVNSFYGKLLEGEEAYWWTQFCSAVEFIKTMV